MRDAPVCRDQGGRLLNLCDVAVRVDCQATGTHAPLAEHVIGGQRRHVEVRGTRP